MLSDVGTGSDDTSDPEGDGSETDGGSGTTSNSETTEGQATCDGPAREDTGAEMAGDRDTDEADTGEDPPARYARLDRIPTGGSGNSLWEWTEAKSPARVALNYIVIVLCRILPSLRAKNWLLRRIGVTVGRGAAWGLESTPDVFWPERITVESDAIIGYDATLLCHEFLQDEYRVGDIRVGERAMLGAGVVVLPGVEIGADAQVAANSLVAQDVPPGATVAGVPAQEVDR